MSENNIEKSTISVRAMTGILVACVFWAASLAGVYFAMKADIDKATALAIEVKSRVDKYNLDILNYKVGEMDKKIETLDAKANSIIDILNAPRRTGR